MSAEGEGPDPSSGTANLVRLFTLVGGRTAPTRDVFTLLTMVTSVPSWQVRRDNLLPEHCRMLELCSPSTAVAEISAQLGLPVSVTIIMLSDLLDAGLILVHPPSPPSGPSEDLDLLWKVRDSLDRL
ncbi:DUF742 domain-containing protein [Streptomyces sp. NPDC051776]|uniref:DUF742 domain-containing protein n=1 Tax=Streptomyces sp. NPDC051776 TaxID=3155414 RepID=UPI00343B2859